MGPKGGNACSITANTEWPEFVNYFLFWLLRDPTEGITPNIF